MQFNHFSIQVRVYYEDTDVGGVVYYANYLKFMERTRTEWLRHLGFNQFDLSRDQGVVFAVRRAEVDYLKPTRLDDQLDCRLWVERSAPASMVFRQEILRGDEVLCRGVVKIACLDAAGFSPRQVPESVSLAVATWMKN